MQFEPHDYQRYCIERIIQSPKLALWLDMGLGKTASILTAVKRLRYYLFDVSKALVIAPKKVAEATWDDEAAKWDHLRGLKISQVLGTPQQRKRALATPADIYITNRENTCWLVDYYRNDWPFDLVCLDESTSFKNHAAKRFRALKLVSGKTPRFYELTGTPSPHGYLDLWPQIYLLDGGERLGKTFGGYRERYFEPDKRSRTQIFSYRLKPGAEEAIREKLADIVISMKAEDYLDLPELIEHDVPVRLDAKAKKAYDTLERDLLLEIDEDVIDVGSAAILHNKLQQLCDGAVYDADRKTVELHRCKIDALLETIEGLHGEHALVAYAFQHDRERILEALKNTSLRVRVYTGAEDAQAWNAGEIDILLAHPASCAFGLNLQQGGRHVIWFGHNRSLELYQQFNKRLHRQGQPKPVMVHRLIVKGGEDEDIVKALAGRDDMQSALMEALKARIRRVKEDSK